MGDLMSTEQHTQGPWRVDPTHPLCIESDRGNIALVNLARSSEADARLIAAAPQLLASLREMLGWYVEGSHAVPRIYIERANAAIAKAEGR
jgi:hypothetical protein